MLSENDKNILSKLQTDNPAAYDMFIRRENEHRELVKAGCHDLRNIVALISGSYQLLCLTHSELNHDSRFLQMGEDIQSLVKGFNDISAFRYASTLKPSPAALSCIVDMLNEYIDTHYPDKKEYIHIDASGSDEKIVLDYARISSAVCCLISNAIDASDFIANPAAMVFVNMDTEISGSHKLLTFDITNIGSAPSPDIADSMTKPFHSDKSGHLGLGLAIVSETAAAMNGTLEWTHQNGITCFTLKIPY